MMMTQQKSQGSTEEVSLRPPTNSMIHKPKPTSALPKASTARSDGHSGPLGPLLDAALPTGNTPGSIIPPKAPALGLNPLKDVPIITKSGSASSDKQRSPRKDQGPTKEDMVKKSEVILESMIEQQSIDGAVNALQNLKLTDKFWTPVLTRLMSKVLEKSDSERELVNQLLTRIKQDSMITVAQFFDAYKQLVSELPDIEKDVPRAKSLVAGLAAKAVTDGLATLAELAQPLEGGHQYPLFLLTLQQLHKLQGNDKATMTKMFNESKVQLMNMLPELDRTKERLGEILDDRGLGFLFPLLRIESDLWKQIQADGTPAQFYKWIKENLDPSCYTMPGFVSALFTVLLKYIAQEASSEPNGLESTPPADKADKEKEKELLERYRPVLQAFLHDHVNLQVTVLHSLQAFCHALNFPKGMLLRWFVMLYDLEILEEDAFLKWKEDLTDTTPGKGKALFQVSRL